MSGSILSVDEYWQCRLGSSGVPVCLVFGDPSWEDMGLLDGSYADDNVQTIVRCINTISSAINDLLSIKKEIRSGVIRSLVPIMFLLVGDLQKTIQEIVGFIAAEIKNLDDAAALLF